MRKTLDLGATRLELILDGYGELEGDDVFSPARREEWSVARTGLESAPKLTRHGKLIVAGHALLIRGDPDLTLVDTGWGEAAMWDPGETALRGHSVIKRLGRMGIAPEQIARVILTHAHRDHVLGNTVARNGEWVAAFPNAEYIMQHSEADEVQRAAPEVWQRAFEPLAGRGQLRLVRGRTQIGAPAPSPALTCWPTPGHSRGHQALLIESGDRAALFLGDLAILARNMERLEWGPNWAWSPDADRQSRREVAEWAVAHQAVLIIGHEPDRSFIRLEQADSGYRAVPVM